MNNYDDHDYYPDYWDYLDILIMAALFLAPFFQIYKLVKYKKVENISFSAWFSLFLCSIGILAYNFHDFYNNYLYGNYAYDIWGMIFTGVFVIENALVLLLIWKYKEKEQKTPANQQL